MEENKDSPVVYKNINVKNELDCLTKLLQAGENFHEAINAALKELYEYVVADNDSWAFSDDLISFIGDILKNPIYSSEVRVHLLKVLANVALKDDVIYMLHQNRKDHALMNYGNDFEKHCLTEQQSFATFICNLFENDGPSEWLLYISEWEYNNQMISNVKVTTKVIVNCILSTCQTLKTIGTHILYNLTLKDIRSVAFDDVAVELTMAILQFFGSNIDEEQTYRSLKALVTFVEVTSDVTPLIQMIGPHPKMFAGLSERVDQLLSIICTYVPS